MAIPEQVPSPFQLPRDAVHWNPAVAHRRTGRGGTRRERERIMDQTPDPAHGARGGSAQRYSSPYRPDEHHGPLRPLWRSRLRARSSPQPAGTAVLRASLPAARTRAGQGCCRDPGRDQAARAGCMTRLMKPGNARASPRMHRAIAMQRADSAGPLAHRAADAFRGAREVFVVSGHN